MSFTLPPLPYELDALEPFISREGMDFHYNKHHATYVKNLNDLTIHQDEWRAKSLEDVVKDAASISNMPIFNNAAQIWNHTFFWENMCPQGGGEPKDEALMRKIQLSFGSFDVMKAEFSKAAVTVLGSGWGWLVLTSAGMIEVRTTSNANTPLTDSSVVPLMTCDVWEHAYYIDYRNRRPDFVEVFFNSLINWDSVAKRLRAAESR